MTIKTILATLLLSGVALAQGQFSGGGGNSAKRIQGVAVSATPPSAGNCLVASSSTLWAPGSCTGTGSAFQVNGTPTSNQTTINFQDATTFNGLTIAFTNPSVGNIKVGLSGTATKSLLPAQTVYNDQANTWSTGLQDFSAATNLRLRVGAGATTASNGEVAYDTTNKNWHMFGNAVDNINVVIPVSISPANNDCAKFTVAAGVITLNTAGAACGAGGGGGPATSVNGVAITTQSLLNFVNSNAFNGLTFTFANPSAGDVKAGFSGTLGNAGLTNSSLTVTAGSGLTGGGSVSLGSSVTLTLGTIAIGNTPATTNGDLLFVNGSTALARLPIGSNGLCLTVASGLPAWGSCSTGSISGAGANTQVAIFSGASTLNSFSTFTSDSSGNVTLTSVNTSVANGGLDGTEGTGGGLTAAAGHDLLWADSAAHRLKMNNNNGGAVQVVGSGADINTSDQVTITHIASATDNRVSKFSTGNMVNSGISDNATTISWTENFDISGAAVTTGFKPPAGAGAAPTTAGVVAFDSTAKTLVIGDGSLTGKLMYITGSPANNDCAAFSVVGSVFKLQSAGAACGAGGSGMADPGANGLVFRTALNTTTNVVGSAANQLIVTGTSGTGTSVAKDFPDFKYIPAANNVNGAGGIGWTCPSSTPVALLRAGTNNKDGLLSPWGAADVCYFKIHLPKDWDSAVSTDVSIDLTSTDATNGHTVILQVASACAKGDGSTTDDVAYNTAQSMSTITLNGNANRTWTATLTGLTNTGCAAQSTLWVKVSRTTDTATNVGVYGAVVDYGRQIVLQAQ